MFPRHSIIPWGSFRGQREEKWGSFQGRDHFGVNLRIISGLGIISGSGSFRGLYKGQFIELICPVRSEMMRSIILIYHICTAVVDESEERSAVNFPIYM